MYNFSIVIATAIRPTISRLLDSINDSTVYPQIVIISVPKGLSYSLEKCYKFNTKVISEAVGQVSQRIAGFTHVETQYCIQMDDDIYFSKDFLSSLVKRFSQLPFNSALAPIFILDNKPISVLVSPKPFLSKLMYYVLDSSFNPKYGSITKSGFPIGINPIYNNLAEDSLIRADWLQGACIIHHQSNLIVNWKYKFSGKAFAEDLIHSKLLSLNNINLYVDRKLLVSSINSELELKYRIVDFIKTRYPLYRALKSVPGHNPKLIRYLVFSFLYFLSKIITYILKKISI